MNIKPKNSALNKNNIIDEFMIVKIKNKTEWTGLFDKKIRKLLKITIVIKKICKSSIRIKILIFIFVKKN